MQPGPHAAHCSVRKFQSFCPRSSTPYLSRLTGSVEPTHEGHWADSKKEVRLLTHGSEIASAKRNDEKTGQLNFFDMLNVYPASSMPNMVKETDNCEWNIVWSHFPYEFLPICKVWIAKHRRQEDCFVSKWHPDKKCWLFFCPYTIKHVCLWAESEGRLQNLRAYNSRTL